MLSYHFMACFSKLQLILIPVEGLRHQEFVKYYYHPKEWLCSSCFIKGTHNSETNRSMVTQTLNIPALTLFIVPFAQANCIWVLNLSFVFFFFTWSHEPIEGQTQAGFLGIFLPGSHGFVFATVLVITILFAT